jgi:hypothetical protein
MLRVRAGAEDWALPLGSLLCYHGFYEAANCDNKETPGPSANWQGDANRSPPAASHLKALDAWIAQQTAPLTRPEAIRAMMETILHILSKDSDERSPKKAKSK